MTPARNSPSTRTLGSQLVAISTVLALIARMLRTASRPMPVIATSRKATTAMILVRIEYFSSMAAISWFWAGGNADDDERLIRWDGRRDQARHVLRLC